MKPPRTPLAFLFSSVPLVALLVACGGASANPPGGGGPSDEAFCAAAKTYATVCPAPGVSTACFEAGLAEITQDCTALAAEYSAAFKSGVTSCAAPTSCPADNDPFDTPCLKQAVEGTALTSAQNKLAADFCAPCAASLGQTSSQCVATFWGLAEGGTVVGTGGVWLTTSDAIVERIDSTCVPALGAGGQTACSAFQQCGFQVYAVMSTLQTPSACVADDAGAGSDGGY